MERCLSPERETLGEIARLQAEIDDDLASAAAHRDDIAELLDLEDAWSEGSPYLSKAAIALHHYYCAVESCLERIVRTFEGMVSEGPDWHRELLHVATLEIPQVRPPVLRADTEAALSHLLRFRHFLRHAYSAKLQVDRMRELAELLVHASVEVDRDLTDFRDYLLRCQAALSSP